MQVVKVCNRLSKESKRKNQKTNGDLLLNDDQVIFVPHVVDYLLEGTLIRGTLRNLLLEISLQYRSRGQVHS